MLDPVKIYLARLVPNCDPAGISTSSPACGKVQLQQLVINVIQFLRDTSIIIAVVFILWGGFLLMTAGGSADRIGKGKKAITAAVIGIVIVIVAFFAVNLFIDNFTKCTGKWWSFDPNFKC